MEKSLLPDNWEKFLYRDKWAWIIANYPSEDEDRDYECPDYAPEEIQKEYKKLCDFRDSYLERGIIID